MNVERTQFGDLNKYPTVWSSRIGASGAIRVTERPAADTYHEVIIIRERHPLYNAFDALHSPVAIIDPSGEHQFRLRNAAFERLPYSHVEAIAEALEATTIKTDQERINQLEAAKTGRDVPKTEVKVERGEGVWYELLLSSTTGINREPLVMVEVHDITRPKLQEQTTWRAVANTAHDLKGPLAVIKAYADTLRRKIEKGGFDPAVAKDQLAAVGLVALASADAVNRNIKAIRQTQETKREAVAIGHLMCEILESPLINFRLEQNNIELELQLSDPDLIVAADAGQWSSLLQILTNNSIESMEKLPAGQIRKLLITAAKTDGRLVTHFKDTGKGIAVHNWNKVISGYSEKKGGTGFGVPQARQTALKHGGDLWIQESTTAEMLRKHPELGHTGTDIAVSLSI